MGFLLIGAFIFACGTIFGVALAQTNQKVNEVIENKED